MTLKRLFTKSFELCPWSPSHGIAISAFPWTLLSLQAFLALGRGGGDAGRSCDKESTQADGVEVDKGNGGTWGDADACTFVGGDAAKGRVFGDEYESTIAFPRTKFRGAAELRCNLS